MTVWGFLTPKLELEGSVVDADDLLDEVERCVPALRRKLDRIRGVGSLHLSVPVAIDTGLCGVLSIVQAREGGYRKQMAAARVKGTSTPTPTLNPDPQPEPQLGVRDDRKSIGVRGRSVFRRSNSSS